MAFDIMPHVGFMEPHSIMTILCGLRTYIIHELRSKGTVEIPGLVRFKRTGGKVTATVLSGTRTYFQEFDKN